MDSDRGPSNLDVFLTLIRERILPYIEVTVKPLFLYFFGLEINDWVRFPFQINLKVLF